MAFIVTLHSRNPTPILVFMAIFFYTLPVSGWSARYCIICCIKYHIQTILQKYLHNPDLYSFKSHKIIIKRSDARDIPNKTSDEHNMRQSRS